MKINSFISICLLSIGYLSCQSSLPKLSPDTIVDTYHGHQIEDSYRKIENLDDPEVKKWLEAQENYTRNELNKISKRGYLIDKQRDFDARNVISVSDLYITKEDDYFYIKSNVKDGNAKLFYKKGIKGQETLLFDVELFRPNGEYIINYSKPSWDGSKVVIGLTKNDEEISELFVIDVHSKKISQPITKNSWPSAIGGIQWLPDNSGFTYVHLPITDNKSNKFLLNTKSVLHLFNDDPKHTIELLSKNNNPKLKILKEDFPVVSILDNTDQYIFGEIRGASPYADTYYSQDKFKNLFWKSLFTKDEKIKKFRVVHDSIIYLTANNASNFEIRKTSILNPDFKNPITIVKELPESVIKDFVLTSKGLFFSTTTNGVVADLYRKDHNGLTKIKLPKVFGSINLSAKSKEHDDLWITTKGWMNGATRYRFDHNSNLLIEENITPKADFPEFNDLIVEELLVKSHDGEDIPLSLVYKKGIKKDGSNPVMLRGYGSYGFSMFPYFSPSILTWVLEGGIFATPHVRGGGEKGENWHLGGYKTTKPNTWKDLISCTEYLIYKKYSSANKTVIWSASAGGILIGRALTERPDLFAVAIIESGSMNMIRSEIQPNGANNIKEFGTVKIKEEFEALLEMDAYHHIKNGVSYPATLITTGLNDPRVVAWDPAKFAVKLQAANSSQNPILFSVDMKGGHGFDTSKANAYKKRADVLSFALWQTGHPEYQPKE
ncbi:prolyl oligopeptidase family serine peptidase [Aquimarina aquimarini]|uniref:prolyl oligopeptidase family serine peptidase n=1 Tax=Aquimarina aquimarini TaxID=1191734 RepID=UPI000D55F782|nr:prolyl oligopeptidase family serine peptidase [Aquimarina aquimarini]